MYARWQCPYAGIEDCPLGFPKREHILPGICVFFSAQQTYIVNTVAVQGFLPEGVPV
jgi:hypothetical protein